MSVSPQFFIMGAQRVAPAPQVLSWKDDVLTAEVSGKSGFLDCIGPKNSHDPLLVSAKVASDLKAAGITGGRLVQADIQLKNSSRPNLRDQYFCLKATGHARAFRKIYSKNDSKLDFIKSVYDQGDSLVVQVRRSPKEFVVQWVIDEEEWEGSDLFNTQFQRMFGEICCTFKVVELAKAKGWTGFAFTAFDSIARNYMDFTSLEWPPETWYPRDQPVSND